MARYLLCVPFYATVEISENTSTQQESNRMFWNDLSTQPALQCTQVKPPMSCLSKNHSSICELSAATVGNEGMRGDLDLCDHEVCALVSFGCLVGQGCHACLRESSSSSSSNSIAGSETMGTWPLLFRNWRQPVSS